MTAHVMFVAVAIVLLTYTYNHYREERDVRPHGKELYDIP